MSGSEFSRAVIKKSALSTNSGLRHIHLACEGANGTFDLELGVGRRSVLFTLTVPALLLEKSERAASSLLLPLSMQETSVVDVIDVTDGLKICAIDDSQVNRPFKVEHVRSINRIP